MSKRLMKLVCTRCTCVFLGLRGDTCPTCGGAAMTERAAQTARALLEAERAALYAIAEPTREQWRRLHELDLALGY